MPSAGPAEDADLADYIDALRFTLAEMLGENDRVVVLTAPAQASQLGYLEHASGANHASLLGKAFADPIVRGIEHVLTAAARKAS